MTNFVELYLNGAWRDFTSDVYQRDGGFSITRGRSNESSLVERSSCRVTLNNRNGVLSPRNPIGPYYGYLGRNAPFRAGVKEGLPYLYMTGESPCYLTAPDNATNSVVGDIEVQVDVSLRSWNTGVDLAGKYITAGNQRSWTLWVDTDGFLNFAWSANGSTVLQSTSSEKIPFPTSGRLAVKATLDVNNGSGGNTTRFFTAPTMTGTWTQLGGPIVKAGITSIFNSTAPVVFGAKNSLSTAIEQGKLWNSALYNGISTSGGTVVASANPSSRTPGDTSWTEGTNTWTVTGADAEITDRRTRFTGETASFPSRWDTTGNDVWVPIEASGILRRLSQGASPVNSSMYRGVIGSGSKVKAYWPLEDLEGSTRMASAVSGGYTMKIAGTPTLASNTSFKCSSPIPVMGTGSFTGSVKSYASTGTAVVSFLMSVPAGGTTANSVVCSFTTGGSIKTWKLLVSSNGDLGINAYDHNDAKVYDPGYVAFAVNGKLLDISIRLEQNGANINSTIISYEVDDPVGLLAFTQTATAENFTRVVDVALSPDRNQSTVAYGHLRVLDNSSEVYSFTQQVSAWNGEPAGARIKRLCDEEGVDFASIGDINDSSLMGYQGQKTFLELIRECEATDLGVVYEPSDYTGIGYRTRRSLYAQQADLTLDYNAADLSAFDTEEDDQGIANDITVKRVEGSSSRAVLESGALSILPPPNGVGRYDTSIELPAYSDTELKPHADWRLHLSTLDEARVSQMEVQLHRQNFVNDPALYTAATQADIGSKIVVSNPPSWISANDTEQLVQGYTETVSNFTRTINFNTSPASSYNVGRFNSTDRYSGEGTVLAGTMTTTSTSRTITNPEGLEWTISDGSFDILVAGEAMTVTNVTGSGTTQTLTVTRSVNGVVKSHLAGEAVTLLNPSYYAL